MVLMMSALRCAVCEVKFFFIIMYEFFHFTFFFYFSRQSDIPSLFLCCPTGNANERIKWRWLATVSHTDIHTYTQTQVLAVVIAVGCFTLIYYMYVCIFEQYVCVLVFNGPCLFSKTKFSQVAKTKAQVESLMLLRDKIAPLYQHKLSNLWYLRLNSVDIYRISFINDFLANHLQQSSKEQITTDFLTFNSNANGPEQQQQAACVCMINKNTLCYIHTYIIHAQAYLTYKQIAVKLERDLDRF